MADIHRVSSDRIGIGGYSLGALTADPISPYLDQNERRRLQLDALVDRCDALETQSAATETSRSVWRTTAIVAMIVATVFVVIAVWLAFSGRPDSVEVGPTAPSTVTNQGASVGTATVHPST